MKRYLQCILIGVPIWYVVGILIIFAPEFTAALNLPPDIQAAAQKHDGDIIMICYIGLAVGDLGSGVMSQVLKSRRRAVYIFMSFTFAMTLFYLNMNRLGITPNLTHLYILSFLLGFGTGYWAVFVTNAAEQFGTNIRSTVTTTVPNFVRGSLELVLIVYGALRGAKIAPGQYEGLGMIDSALLVGIVVFLIAFVSLYFLPEGYGKDLDYIEEEELASEPTQPAGAEQ
jgi:MFS family permease